jgi:hypothetical protein
VHVVLGERTSWDGDAKFRHPAAIVIRERDGKLEPGEILYGKA